MIENKTFWKFMKPILSEKSQIKSNITLVESNDIFSDKEELAKKFNDFCKNVVN